jgi:hypothetical protein
MTLLPGLMFEEFSDHRWNTARGTDLSIRQTSGHKSGGLTASGRDPPVPKFQNFRGSQKTSKLLRLVLFSNRLCSFIKLALFDTLNYSMTLPCHRHRTTPRLVQA